LNFELPPLLAGFMAVIQALVSVVADQGDAIQVRQCTQHHWCSNMLLKGIVILTAAARTRPETLLHLLSTQVLLFGSLIGQLVIGVSNVVGSM
jgi:hypothetical protein